MGKSVITAQIHKLHYPQVLAYHYCVHSGGLEYRDPRSIVKSIMAQLCDRLPPYAEQLNGQEFKQQLSLILSEPFCNVVDLWNGFVVAPLCAIKPELIEQHRQTQVMLLQLTDDLQFSISHHSANPWSMRLPAAAAVQNSVAVNLFSLFTRVF
jgi:hypothetical protein